jgi:FKBP-type peptidyl-prolyl cis-trans isomerase
MLLAVLAGVIVACDDQKTMQEYLREENKAIERYINSQGIKVVETYPADSTFAADVYYKTTDGLYMHVVDKGNNVPWTYGKRVLVRFEELYYIKSYVSGDTTAITFPSREPIEFIYGIPASYQTDYYGLACNGWAISLQYLGEGAIVDLIIPSKLGSSSANTSFQPVLYKNLILKRAKTGE